MLYCDTDTFTSYGQSVLNFLTGRRRCRRRDFFSQLFLSKYILFCDVLFRNILVRRCLLLLARHRDDLYRRQISTWTLSENIPDEFFSSVRPWNRFVEISHSKCVNFIFFFLFIFFYNRNIYLGRIYEIKNVLEKIMKCVHCKFLVVKNGSMYNIVFQVFNYWLWVNQKWI